MANMKDLEIQFTDEQITAFSGISLLYKMLDNCHFKEELSTVSLPKQGSNRGYSPIQLIYGLFTGVWCGASSRQQGTCWPFTLAGISSAISISMT